MKSDSPRLKLAIVYDKLLHYRYELFDLIGTHHELTVFTPKCDRNLSPKLFKIREVPATYVGGFRFQKGLRAQLLRDHFDACIVFIDPRNLSSVATAIFPVAPRTLTWGAWKTESFAANFVRLRAMNQAQANIVYCHRHAVELEQLGAAPAKLYVAHNTIHVGRSGAQQINQSRRTVLFVGSLAPRKGLGRLLRIFHRVSQYIDHSINLVIVGDGPERELASRLVIKLGLESRVQFVGKVLNPDTLADLYSQAIVSVSLNQAGLSVLQSMGHGVPFLTTEQSISGGEVDNIVDGFNGVLVEDSDPSICEAIVKICSSGDWARQLGRNAAEHYETYATMDNYAQGFLDALDGVRRCAVWKGPAHASLGQTLR